MAVSQLWMPSSLLCDVIFMLVPGLASSVKIKNLEQLFCLPVYLMKDWSKHIVG
jgi:hypothetical protein